MKNSILLICLGLLLCNCQGEKTTKGNEGQVSEKIKPGQSANIDDSQLEINGIWAENVNEDAWYWIKNDSIYFIEHLDQPIPYTFVDDTLTFIFDGFVTKERVILLTEDSLWLDGGSSKDIVKLYKRKP